MPGLLEPIRIGSLILPNRLVMPPMATRLATETGEVTDALVEHYRERAPGVGMVIVEHAFVTLGGRLTLTQPGIHEDGMAPGMSRLVRAIHQQDSRATLQINHCGAKALSDPTLGSPAGPSAVSLPNTDIIPRELSVEEIGGIVVAFGQAARRARDAGFDAVEVHGAHGYINNQFTSPFTNKRIDQYGGGLEKRMRLPLEIVSAVRSEVGSNYPLLYRLGANDMIEGGLTIQGGRRIARALVEAGVNAIDVSGGLGGIEHPTIKSQGYFIPMAEEIKRAARVPVIGVGGITEPAFADRVIREGRVDMVAVGRAILNDPKWARKAVDMLSACQ